MRIDVCERVAAYIRKQDRRFEIIWHGGEPLAIGVQNFESLLHAFKDVNCNHSIQTNGTLINDQWCELFKDYDINVGVSLDGTAAMNEERVNWNGLPAYANIIRGIEKLKSHSIPFSVISVISNVQLESPEELYAFFSELGCWSWGLNIEETEGAHIRKIKDMDETVSQFWARLFAIWKKDPVLRIREFDFALSWMDRVTQQPDFERIDREVEMFPTISCKGDLVLLSPEFVDLELLGHNFKIGNVLENDISDLLESIEHYPMVHDFSAGIQKCASNCEYFSFCGGGYASNKYFENGSLDSTVTQHCINTKMSLLNNVIKSI